VIDNKVFPGDGRMGSCLMHLIASESHGFNVHVCWLVSSNCEVITVDAVVSH
jgi:hypothetical protein